jgi:hypothetical protein
MPTTNLHRTDGDVLRSCLAAMYQTMVVENPLADASKANLLAAQLGTAAPRVMRWVGAAAAVATQAPAHEALILRLAGRLGAGSPADARLFRDATAPDTAAWAQVLAFGAAAKVADLLEVDA